MKKYMMKVGKRILIIIFIITVVSFQRKDRFIGEVVTKWLPDGRKMELLQDFTYVDPAGKKWKAPAGCIVDGASIPQIFWTFIGGPYEESYRKASVVHDYYCIVPKNQTWQDVHKMFYNACITAGVTEIKAKLMYGAVYAGGPRWEKNSFKSAGNQSKYISIKVTTPEDKFAGIAKWIEQNNPDTKKIADTLDTVVQINSYFDIKP